MTPATQTLTTLLSRHRRQQVMRALQAGEGVEALQQRDVIARLPRRRKTVHAYTAPPTHDCVGFFDEPFPAALREIPDPPLVLYYEGDARLLQETAIAIVGARRCTRLGATLAHDIAAGVSARDVVVVSGLALGIDAAAHRGALEVGGRTVAFLGGCIDELYPAANRALARAIVQAGGAIVSEYPKGIGPRAHQFPERNRLISGASVATVLVEAGEKSGSLITARMALEQGRDVYAVPGPVTSELSKGCHRVIRQGAALVTSAEDVLEELGIASKAEEAAGERDPMAELTDAQRRALACTQGIPQTTDEILLQLNTDDPGVTLPTLLEILGELELFGFVRQTPLGYIRTS